MTKYIAHMTIDRDIEVEFDADVVGKKRPYKKLQELAIIEGIKQGIIDREKDGVSIPWIENVESGDDIE